jgi:chitodextrinase
LKRLKLWLALTAVIVALVVGVALSSNAPPQTPARIPGPSFTYTASNTTFTFTAIDGYENYAWNFGDGSTGTGSIVTHTYETSGNYTVTLTASPLTDALTPLSTYQLVMVTTVTTLIHNYFVNLNITVGNSAT